MEINVEEIWIIALKILKSDCVVFLYKINNEIEVIRMMKIVMSEWVEIILGKLRGHEDHFLRKKLEDFPGKWKNKYLDFARFFFKYEMF
jgi:hypothetical protein